MDIKINTRDAALVIGGLAAGFIAGSMLIKRAKKEIKKEIVNEHTKDLKNEIKQEINTMISGKKFEFKALMIMPIFLILLLSVLMAMKFTWKQTSLFQTILMFGLIAAGAGFIVKGMFGKK